MSRRNKNPDGAEEPEKGMIPFRVAAALWQELGERLVGQKSTALAELVKNSYDADASTCRIEIEPSGNGKITIEDNGHGMSLSEFKSYWMTVGTPHKRDAKHSRYLRRPLTGSKGVGRFAVRLLADEVLITTVPRESPTARIRARLDWRQTKTIEQLTETEVSYELDYLPEPSKPFFRVELRHLREKWTPDDVAAVAKEIWKLQSPFADTSPSSQKRAFRVVLHSPDGELTEAFRNQMQAVLELWTARIWGTISGDRVSGAIEFRNPSQSRDGLPPLEIRTFDEEIPKLKGSTLKEVRFEVRVFDLKSKQKFGIKIDEAREYYKTFRGVHIYDAGFRLPYYGSAESDWLRLNADHARRIGRSELLPEALQVPSGLLHLPPIDHLFGAVEVDTSRDDQGLEITITRDRLKPTRDFDHLANGVRVALDWYAMEKARRRYQEIGEKLAANRSSEVLRTVEEVVEAYARDLPKELMRELQKAIKRIEEERRLVEERSAEEAGVLGSLATAGISAIAFQHEISKQVLVAERLVEDLDQIQPNSPAMAKRIQRIRTDLQEWVTRTRTVGEVLGHFGDSDNVRKSDRYLVLPTVTRTIAQLEPLLPGITYNVEVPPQMKFPTASYAEWVSILQNVILNAANAMQSTKEKRLRVVGKETTRRASLTILDTGTGVEISTAEELFQPFERRLTLQEERRKKGFGGTGLGLTIVRMIASRRQCRVRFVEPLEPYATAFELEWSK